MNTFVGLFLVGTLACADLDLAQSASSSRRSLSIIDARADLALGQLDLSHRGFNIVNAGDMALPSTAVVDRGADPDRLYVADSSNHRVLGFFNAETFVNGQPADLVIGQPDFLTADPLPASPQSLAFPVDVAVDTEGNLYVADAGNNRVVFFRDPFATDTIADSVVGQPDLFSGACATSASGLCEPSGIDVDGTDLVVADRSNHRVLRFSLPITGGQVAAQVFGQVDFVSGLCNGTDAELCAPSSVVLDRGRMWVADGGNDRVMGYKGNSGYQTLGDGASSDVVVLGAVNVIGTRGANLLVVSDDRLLVYDRPASTDQDPDAVYGQPDFTSAGCNRGMRFNATSDGLCVKGRGGKVTTDDMGQIWLADALNHRVLRLPGISSGVGPAADRVLGQSDFGAGAINRVAAQTLSSPWSVAVDRSVSPPRVYVADAFNNRVLGWSDASALRSGLDADIVLGQPNMTTTGCDRNNPTPGSLCFPTDIAVDGEGNLYVTEFLGNRVVRFDRPFETDQTADLILSEATFPVQSCGGNACLVSGLTLGPDGALYLVVGPFFGAPSEIRQFDPPLSDGMSSARSVEAQGILRIGNDGTLYAADTSQNRVFIFDGDGSRPVDFVPDRVLGQADFTGTECHRGGAAAADTLCGPVGLAVANGTLYVSDSASRILVFNDIANKLTAASADDVIGQPDFLTVDGDLGDCLLEAATASSLCGVAGLAIDLGGSLFAADRGNNRVVVYSANRSPQLSGIADLEVQVGDIINVSITASDENGDLLRLGAMGLPASLSLADAGDGTATIQGTAVAADEGAHDITVQARDTGTPSQQASVTFRLTVLAELNGSPGGCGCRVADRNHGPSRYGGAWALVLYCLLGLFALRSRRA